MLPIGDDNADNTGPAFVTISLIVLNILAFFLEINQPSEAHLQAFVEALGRPSDQTWDERLYDTVVHVDGKGMVYAVNGSARGDISAGLGLRAIGEGAVHALECDQVALRSDHGGGDRGGVGNRARHRPRARGRGRARHRGGNRPGRRGVECRGNP